MPDLCRDRRGTTVAFVWVVTAASKMGETVGVIFDLDGVLTDTADAHADAWQMLAQAHSFSVTQTQLDAIRGRSRADSLKALLGERVVEDAEFARMLAEKNGYYTEQIRRLTPRDVLPGAHEAVRTVKQRGAQVAVGSASKNARAVLDALGLTASLDAIVDGNDVERPKPDPEVFLLAAKRLDVPPNKCVVVEDADSGVAAAKAADMLTIGVGAHLQTDLTDLHAATLSDIDFDDVIDLLEKR